jgi:hypothetical protein
MTGQMKWTCDKCGTTISAMQRGNHVRFRCPEQGNMLKVLEKQKAEAARKAAEAAKPVQYYEYLPCKCGCPEKIGQVKGKKKKYFVDDVHYQRQRYRMHAKQIRAAREAEAKHGPVVEDEEAEARRLAEELAPIASKDAEIARKAEQVPMVTGADSFMLWAKCFGFSVDVSQAAV